MLLPIQLYFYKIMIAPAVVLSYIVIPSLLMMHSHVAAKDLVSIVMLFFKNNIYLKWKKAGGFRY